jgi:hypothetical protein
MEPRYCYAVDAGYANEFERSLRTMMINGEPVDAVRHDHNVFRVKLGQPNLEKAVITVGNESVSAKDLGLEIVDIQDETSSNAYHVPQGSLLVFDPQARQATSSRPSISTLDIAPTLLRNFGVAPLGHMTGRPAF